MCDSERAEFRKKNVGVVYQFHHLLPEFNVLENVMMPMRIKRLSYSYARKKAFEILDIHSTSNISNEALYLFLEEK